MPVSLYSLWLLMAGMAYGLLHLLHLGVDIGHDSSN